MSEAWNSKVSDSGLFYMCSKLSQLLNQNTQVNQSESFTNFAFKTTIACLALTAKLEDLSSLFCLQNWPFHLG